MRELGPFWRAIDAAPADALPVMILADRMADDGDHREVPLRWALAAGVGPTAPFGAGRGWCWWTGIRKVPKAVLDHMEGAVTADPASRAWQRLCDGWLKAKWPGGGERLI